jgi:23S rRNA (pseudouridine1915-N3)-methyltransferase
VLFRFLWIGGTKSPFFASAEREYLKRIGQFVPAEIVISPESRKTSRHAVGAAMERDEKAVRSRLREGTYLVALDSNGSSFSSEEFAGRLNQFLVGGVSEVTFLVGGHLGIPGGILEGANLRLSLSRLTFPHELARVVLLEQVYRGLTIVRGLPYHK